MIHAYFDNLNLKGYERYCGWIQIIRKEEYNTVNQKENVTTTYEIDFCAQTKPYFCIGFPAELFDAPCKNLGTNEKLIWTAYTYLVDPPSRMNDNQMTFLAGFSWGYTERDEEYISKKHGDHGHGLKRINIVIDKYGGFTKRANEPGVFATEIMFPL